MQRFLQLIIRQVPLKYRKDLLGIVTPEKARKAKRPGTHWYIHTLDKIPALFNGRAIVPVHHGATKWPPCSTLEELQGQQKVAVNNVKDTAGEIAASQFKMRLDYVAFKRLEEAESQPPTEQLETVEA